MLEVPEAVWDFENNNTDSNMVLRQSSSPPLTASLNIKLIYNNDWIQDSSGGDAQSARQRALDVFNEAEKFYNSKFNSSNQLGTKITFNLVDGGKLVYYPKNIIRVSKFNELYRRFK